MFNPKMLELARQLRGFSKKYLAEKLSLSMQTLSDWEQGKTKPKPEKRLQPYGVMDWAVPYPTSSMLRLLL